MLVQTGEAGKLMVEATSTENGGNRLSFAEGIIEVYSQRTLSIVVKNKSKVPVRLLKNMRMATLGDALSTIVLIQEGVPLNILNELPI